MRAVASVCVSPTTARLIALRGPCPAHHHEYGGAGVNLFDALWCSADGSATESACTFEDVRTAMRSLAESGLRFFRFFATLWGSKQALWLMQPRSFWAAFDSLMDSAESMGLYVVPSIGAEAWHLVHNRVANVSLPGSSASHSAAAETLNDLVLNPASAARALAMRYTRELVGRYGARPHVLFWELGNELNLHVNQHVACTLTTARPSANVERSSGERCFNTSSMVEYTRALVAAVRDGDARRPVSSGFAITRPNAWHEETCRRDGSTERCWDIDSEHHWRSMVLWQHEAVDIVSFHAYARQRGCWFEEHQRHVGCLRQDNLTVLEVAADAAASVGKPLYVGEFGGPAPNFTGPTLRAQAFPEALLRWQSRRRPHFLSSLWAWDCPSHRMSTRCLSRGLDGSARMLALLQAAEREVAPWRFCERSPATAALCASVPPGVWPERGPEHIRRKRSM